MFVQLSAAYAPETDGGGERHGWPVVVLDADHLASLTQPDAPPTRSWSRRPLPN